MGSKTVGKVLGVKTQSGSSSKESYTPQYVKLSDGSFQLYDQSKATLNYAPTQTVQGAKGKRELSGSVFSKKSSLQSLQSAQYDGQDIELDNGNIKFYGQNDYDNWKTEQQQKADSLKTAINASQKNLSNSRQQKKNSIFSVSTGRNSTPSGNSNGVFSGITE